MESRLSSPGFAVHFSAPSKKPQADLFGYAAVGKATPVITLQLSIQQTLKNVWGRGVVDKYFELSSSKKQNSGLLLNKNIQ